MSILGFRVLRSLNCEINPTYMSIYQLKIKLKGTKKPPVWRQVQVPSDITFWELHMIIQGAMGWYNAHLHQFYLTNPNDAIGIPSDFDDMLDGSKIKITRWLKAEKDKVNYEYDFGDGWEHEVVLEKVLAPEPKTTYPRLVAGKGACPPEDCGGIWGYYAMVEALNDPNHPEHDDMVEWTGEDVWDPEDFDLEEHQKDMAAQYKIAKKHKPDELFM
jgi:hypothetical protein